MKRIIPVTALALAAAVALSACSGANTNTPSTGTTATSTSSGAAAGTEINVLMVGNPQMNDLTTLTEANFTAKTGIKVNYTVLPENELRDKVAQDVATQAGQYDVATIGAYEASVWTANDWLTDLQPYATKDTTFDVGDILPAMSGILSKDGDMYAIPFYGESAFTMYRKDLFDQWGITMPTNPTWQQIADIAAQIKTKDSTITPICLRGLPGWGENMAVLGSMISAFGGGFFTSDYKPLLTSDGTKAAVQFYVDLVTKYGEAGASQSGFTECLNTFSQGKAAMWFDATSAATTLESSNSTVAGKVGYADAPKDKLRSGWVWAWAWAVPKTTKHMDAAWQFVSWASSKEYEQLALDKVGRVPDGKRASTFDLPKYKTATAAYSDIMLAAIEASDPNNCQAQASPGPGCQYLGIPEFADLGAKIGQEMSAAITGQETADQACEKSQALAQAVASAQ
ncbi:MAG: sugar ABC transporter substrate-binding protein [Propionibacteriaceae bacterium]|jgi:sorbitol/mannitol transport system substrate-binding protein|nr:sugar ABC transporter substrate-binding protein [Propionibacteriaceae bacterium]